MALRAVAVCVGRRPNSLSLLSNTIPHSRHHFSLSHHSPIASPHIQTGYKYYSVRSIQGASTVEPLTPNNKGQGDDHHSSPNNNWKVKMLYDGDCPLCMREVNMLKERDKRYQAIKFVDISSDDYSPKDNQGLDYQTAMGRIHAILSDGTVVKDVEAFRKLYEAVGLGWVYAITKYEPVASIADYVYGVWAKYRLQITGRPPLEEVLKARKQKMETCKDNKACKM